MKDLTGRLLIIRCVQGCSHFTTHSSLNHCHSCSLLQHVLYVPTCSLRHVSYSTSIYSAQSRSCSATHQQPQSSSKLEVPGEVLEEVLAEEIQEVLEEVLEEVPKEALKEEQPDEVLRGST